MTMAEMMARIPVKAVAWEDGEDGRAVLLRPKFLSRRMGWLQKALSRPTFRVRLDETGTFIWRALDGARTAGEVCGAVREHFGAPAEPVEERTLSFLHHLVEGGFASLEFPSASGT
jgi:hypothetical protein